MSGARAFLPLVLVLAACPRTSTTDGAPGQTSATATSNAAAPLGTPASKSAVAIDFESGFDACTMSHRGILLDLADRTMRARSSGGKLAPADFDVREHDGAFWASVRSRSLELSFVSSSEIAGPAGVIVEARVRGGLAKSASVYLNGRPLGALAFTKGETRIASVRMPTASILRGQNDLLLRFNGGSRTGRDALAEIDWIRVGPSDSDSPYAAPTRKDALTTVAIGGVPRRGVSLRAPGSARCSGFIPNGAVLEGFIGAAGGEGEADVRLLVDRAEPRVVGTFHVGRPDDPPGWRPVSLPLGDVGTIAAIELVAKTSAKGARIIFAQPRVVVPSALAETAEAPPQAARGVVLVVLGTLSRKPISPYGGAIAMPELQRLAEGGALFEAHRGVSSFANGSLASMLSGALPRQHGLSDAEATFAPSAFTVAEAARQAGIVTAMFTANPTTSAAYGLARGFDTFVQHPFGDEIPATGVFDEVIRWLDAHKESRFFVVVHARGGHPPWDVTSDEVKDLPPLGYAGSLEPKRAGEGLAKARHSGSRTLADSDRERAFALYAKAVAAHDDALGKLVSHVRAIGRDKDTAWIVTSDVGVDAAAHVPFLEEDNLDEGALALPLVARLPGAQLPARVKTATSSADVARTVLEALALPPPAQLRGEALWATAARGPHVGERPLVATTTNRFSARWAGFALVGTRDREIKLCNLLLDPDCVSDVRATHPLAAELLHAFVFDELVGKKPLPPTPRAMSDEAGAAGLRAWGR